MRLPLGLITFALVVATLLGASNVAVAGHAGKNCGILSVGSNDYRARALAMKCKPARRASLRYLRKGEARAGFDCAPTQGGSFYCQDGPRAYWAVRL